MVAHSIYPAARWCTALYSTALHFYTVTLHQPGRHQWEKYLEAVSPLLQGYVGAGTHFCRGMQSTDPDNTKIGKNINTIHPAGKIVTFAFYVTLVEQGYISFEK